jgi:hypothetical protein
MTALTNTEIEMFDNKLRLYNNTFFSVINVADGLLNETTSIKDSATLNIPARGVSNSTYNIGQFATFIRKIVNFNIKNFDDIPTLTTQDKDLYFIHKTSTAVSTPIIHDTIQENIISTLKVVSVFVDILEAYKYCIDNEQAVSFDSGYRDEVVIDRIEIVSDTTRFYSSSDTIMTPPASDRNVGYIRTVKVSGVNTKVLYLSIQSYKTNMETELNKYNYDNLFTYSGTGTTTKTNNFLNAAALTDISNLKDYTDSTYKYQRYSLADDATVITSTGLTLEARNKTLIVLLMRTLFGLNGTFRKQSVYALYYYYKFVQLYSTFIIHISNVMYNHVALTSGETASLTIETYNMTTNKKTHGVSAFEKQYKAPKTSADKVKITTYSITSATGDTPNPVATIAADTGSNGASTVVQGTISRGRGYLRNPTVILTPDTVEVGRLTIVPVVYAETTTTNDNNIDRLEIVMQEINNTITFLQDELSNYDISTVVFITTVPDDTDNDETTAYPSSPDNMVTINVKKPRIYNSLVVFNDKYDLVKDYVIYDRISTNTYEILSVDNTNTNDFKIKINAVFVDTDIAVDKQNKNTVVFKGSNQQPISPKPTSVSPSNISFAKEFLELRLKDTNTYKVNYITTRDYVSKLETDINFKSSKVTHQNNLYQSQNNKKIFLERQVLAYNIILAIIVIILVAINVVKVDKEVVKTVSLSCFGVIILLFVIYFISNLTYIETFADYSSNKLLYDLSYTSRVVDNSASIYKDKKINKLKGEITKLNNRFLGYFEKLIIMLPASENYNFYKEISEIIDNDRDNKLFIKDNLDYSKNQNDNNINSIKYELENNKLYINTLLISSVIFIGLYNLYIHYITDDKYLSLLIFVCVIIFVIIISYYYITANRRVKTVFKNIYWGPEFSKRF